MTKKKKKDFVWSVFSGLLKIDFFFKKTKEEDARLPCKLFFFSN